MEPLSLPKGFERLVGDLGTGTDVQGDQLVSMVTQTFAGPEMETEPIKLEHHKSQGDRTNYKYMEEESQTLRTISLWGQNQHCA